MVKPLHADDPYELKGVLMDDGEPSIQARIMIEELLGIGTDPEQLSSMFNDKSYVGLFLLTQQLGSELIAELITTATEKMGVSRRIKTTFTDQEWGDD